MCFFQIKRLLVWCTHYWGAYNYVHITHTISLTTHSAYSLIRSNKKVFNVGFPLSARMILKWTEVVDDYNNFIIAKRFLGLWYICNAHKYQIMYLHITRWSSSARDMVIGEYWHYICSFIPVFTNTHTHIGTSCIWYIQLTT